MRAIAAKCNSCSRGCRARGFALVALILAGRAVEAAELRFEQASVKPAARCVSQSSVDAARIALGGVPLKAVIMEAYGVKSDQILGPSWLESDCFTLIAALPAGSGREQIPAMLRSLLADRFRLVAHKESRPASGYVLRVDKGGLKLRPTDTAATAAVGHPDQMRFGAGSLGLISGPITVATLARMLSSKLGVPVEDATQIQGIYDVKLVWAPDRNNQKGGAVALPVLPGDAADSTGGPPDIFKAIRETLGLRLEPHKQLAETMVIDSVQRVPTEN